MKKDAYPPLDDDKILDAPPGLDLEALASREAIPSQRLGPARRPRRRRIWRTARLLLPFLVGIGVGGAIYHHVSSEPSEDRVTSAFSGAFEYPVTGIRLEKSPSEGGGAKPAVALTLMPGESVRVKYGRERVRFVGVERSSSPWASFISLFSNPPILHLGDRPIDVGQEFTHLLQPEKALSETLVLKSPEAHAPAAAFRLDVEMDPRAWLARSLELQDPQDKRTCLEQAAAGDPANVEILLTLGNLLLEQKDAMGATGRFQEALKRDPHHLEASKALATLYWKAQPKRALEIYENLLKIDPGHRLDHYKQIARLQERLGLSPAESYRKILAIQRNDPDATRGLDNLYAKLVEKAQTLEKKGELHKAILEMKQALEVHPSKEGQAYLAALYNNFAFSLAQKGKLEEAIPNYEASLKLDENPVTYLNLADAYEKAKQLSGALKAVEKAHSLKPKDPGVQKNLLLLWAELLMAKKEYAQAVSKLEELHNRLPKDLHVLKTLGMAYWRQGNLSKAITALKGLPPLMASQPPKEQAEIHRLIGDLYRSLGDHEKDVRARITQYDQALKSYKQGLALNKGDKEIQKRFDELAEERKGLRIRSLKSS
jgi:tetratricopeptide (TPR) repeat protein